MNKTPWIRAIVILLLTLSSLACAAGRQTVAERTRPIERTAQTGQETLPPATPTLAATATATTWPPTYTPTAPAQPTQAQPTPTPTLALTAPALTAPAPTATPQPPEPQLQPPASGQDPLQVAPIPELKVKTLDPHSGGMASLSTFRQRMSVQFTPTGGGQSGTYYYDAEVNLPAQAMHVTVRVEGAVAQELPASQVQAIWIGDKLWIKVGNQPWLPVPENVAEMQFQEQTFAVGDFLPFAPQFQLVQSDETVNGIRCAHYRYDSATLPTQYGTVNGSGDVYVALDGGYIVRYTLDGSGTFTQYYQGSGTIKLVYDTYDVGADIPIIPPTRR